MSLRPDLVECWLFRVVAPSGLTDARTDAERLEILLIRRSVTRIFPGLWQCVTGGVEPGERVPMAAIREVEEETGLRGPDVEGWYDLDQVAPFFDEGVDGVVVSAIFAARIRPDADHPRLARARCPALGRRRPRRRRSRSGRRTRTRCAGSATCCSIPPSPDGSRWTPMAAGSPGPQGRDADPCQLCQ